PCTTTTARTPSCPRRPHHRRHPHHRPTASPRFRCAHFHAFSQSNVEAVSGGGRDELVESFGGSIPCEGHAGASVEFDGDVVELLLAVFGEVGAFGEVLADEAVPVFVGAALPW